MTVKINGKELSPAASTAKKVIETSIHAGVEAAYTLAALFDGTLTMLVKLGLLIFLSPYLLKFIYQVLLIANDAIGGGVQ